MTSQEGWSAIAPLLIYQAYPDNDLLPIEPPHPGETIGDFKVRAEEAADTLFLFLCREADEGTDAPEYLDRLDRAIRDIEHVRAAVEPLIDNDQQPSDQRGRRRHTRRSDRTP